MHPDGSTMQPSDISAPIFHFFHPPCTSHATCPRTTASYRKIQQTHAAQIVQTHAELFFFFFFFLNSSPRRENNKCMVVMWCWNRLQHACNYNSWFSISPWDKNFCVKDERCPSPLSPNTHVQTERASSGICPVISTAAAEVTVVAHSHLEGTYMLLFDPATLPLWSTIKRYTFSADVAEWLTFTLKQGQSKLTVGSRTRLLEDLWRSSVTPLWKRWRLSTGVGTCWKCAPQPHRSFAVRRATVPAG